MQSCPNSGGMYTCQVLFSKTQSFVHFTSAVVAVDSSHTTVSSSALWSTVVSVHLQILLVGMCRLCGSWSVAGHNHRKVIGQDPICADLHDMGLGPSRNG